MKLCFTSVKFKIVLYLFYEEKRATIEIRERLFYAFDLRLSLYLSFSLSLSLFIFLTLTLSIFFLSLSIYLSLTPSLTLSLFHSLSQTKRGYQTKYKRKLRATISTLIVDLLPPAHTHSISLSYTY